MTLWPAQPWLQLLPLVTSTEAWGYPLLTGPQTASRWRLAAVLVTPTGVKCTWELRSLITQAQGSPRTVYLCSWSLAEEFTNAALDWDQALSLVTKAHSHKGGRGMLCPPGILWKQMPCWCVRVCLPIYGKHLKMLRGRILGPSYSDVLPDSKVHDYSRSQLAISLKEIS